MEYLVASTTMILLFDFVILLYCSYRLGYYSGYESGFMGGKERL